jgi:hypothetical protein
MPDSSSKIPIYVSCPTPAPAQAAAMDTLQRLSEEHGLDWLRITASSYSAKPPMVLVMEHVAKCYGGLILGFELSHAESVVTKRGTPQETIHTSVATASPWGQIEAAMMLARNLPVLVFRDRGVRGGVFDEGISSMLVLDMPEPDPVAPRVTAAVGHWAREVHRHYDKVNSVFDVFLSFSGEDEAPARELFEFLTAQGLRVFFSRESIPQLGQADYMKAINTALDKARHLVVLSSSAAGFAKPWVEREWTMYLNEKLSGRKTGNVVVVPAAKVAVAHLPIALRSQQVIELCRNGLQEILRFVGPT